MKRIVFVVFMALTVTHISCENQDQAPDQVDFSFDDRASILRLEAEHGSIKYACEEDSSLMYVFLENETLPNLIINDSEKIAAFRKLVEPDFYDGSRIFQSPIECDFSKSHLYEQFEIRVIISGEIKESFVEDSFYMNYSAFVIDNLIKVKECQVEYSSNKNSYSLVDTNWSIIDVIIENDTISPTCEYSNVGFQISPEDDYLIMGLNSGVRGCSYRVSVNEQSLTILQQNVCILAIPHGSVDMWDFDTKVFEVLTTTDIGEDSIGIVPYKFENNLLTFVNDKKNSTLRLFAE